MKIISKFKDYYDYISHLYGVDNKIVYERNLYINFSTPKDNIHVTGKDVDIVNLHFNSGECSYDYRYFWLIICGRRFLLYGSCNTTKWKIFDNTDDKFAKLLPISKSRNIYFGNRFYTPEYFMGEFSQKNLDFNIKLKCPIVMCGKYYRNGPVPTFTESPILGDVEGFVKMYPAEQIYQDIYYFMANQINGSPDLNPPVDVSDKYKIEYHGFDAVSFRPKMRR